MKYMTTRKNDLFNDMFDDVFRAPVFTGNNILKTDVREKDGKYILEVEVPGYKKDEVSISLFNGNLTISAARSSSNEETDDKGRILRQERFSGSTSRTFYVGDVIKDTDIHASFDNGILKIELPTEQKK
ncbi:MAG: Hsp20/alpha crystallin family protein, partial [Solobacterium sp.]|nr:Hsp20/alpha crystallin family protein [Solobacterium sp.]